MIYEWKCQVCGEVSEIDRHLDNYGLGPSESEAACRCGCEHYTKIISMTSTPFEQLRDKGVFDRTHWHKSNDKW